MEVLAEAAGIGLSFLPDHARVGLWVFSIDKGGPGQDWQVLEPMRRLDDAGVRAHAALRPARARARRCPGMTGGGTGLYDTALAAYRQALRDYRPEYSNAVVLMTDGENDDPGSIGLERLVRRLAGAQGPGASGAHRRHRHQRRRATSAPWSGWPRRPAGDAYLAAEPEDILEVFAQAVLSR